MKILPLIVLAALALAACAPDHHPDPPECKRNQDKLPIDGGIGGTGNQDPCKSATPPDDE